MPPRMIRVKPPTRVRPAEPLNNERMKHIVKVEFLKLLVASRTDISQILLFVCRLLMAVGFNLVGRSALHLVQNAYPTSFLTIKSQHENKSAVGMFEAEIKDMLSSLPIERNVYGDIVTPHMQLTVKTYEMLLRFVSNTTNFVIQIEFVSQTFMLPGLQMRNNLINIFDCFDFGLQPEQIRAHLLRLDVLYIHEYIREPNLTDGEYCYHAITAYVHLCSYYPSKIVLAPTRFNQSIEIFYPQKDIQKYMNHHFIPDMQRIILSYIPEERPPQCYGCKNTTFEYFRNVIFLYCRRYIAHAVRHNFPDAHVQYFFCSDCVIRALQRYINPLTQRQQGGPRCVPDLDELMRVSR